MGAWLRLLVLYAPQPVPSLNFMIDFGIIPKSGEEMQKNQKTVPVFLFGSILMMIMLFGVIWYLLTENEHLNDCLKGVAQNQTASASKENSPSEYTAGTEIYKFHVDMTAKKYPLFSRVVKAVYAKSHEHGIDPKLLMSIIETESSFNPYAVSSAGAYGLMQVNYSVWKDELAIDHQKIFDISYNLDLGITILKSYLKIAQNDLHKALHYYNNGFSLTNHSYPSKVISAVFY